MKIYVKNMVCDRCKTSVAQLFESLGINTRAVELGEVDLGEITLSTEQIDQIRERAKNLGFELIDDKKSRIIERIKSLIISLVQKEQTMKTSEYLSQNLHYDYNYLSTLFSTIEGTTIEQYLINLKVEKAKELLVYDEMTLTEIASRLTYSSVAHLSRQFKKVTGLTPSHFKELRDAKRRQSLDKL